MNVKNFGLLHFVASLLTVIIALTVATAILPFRLKLAQNYLLQSPAKIIRTTARRSQVKLEKNVAVAQGKKRSDKTKAKISVSHKGEIFSAERCTNISVARRGQSPFKNLSDAITECQLSYRKLAKLLGLTNSALSMKMTSKRNFTANDIAKLVDIFDKPIEYLMQRIEN